MKTGGLLRGWPIRESKHPPTQFVLAYEADRPTERMVAQQGCFTIADDILLDHAEAIGNAIASMGEPGSDFAGTLRAKYVIPKEAKPRMLRMLHAMNVTAETLFPGLDGFGAGIEELARMGGAT